MEGKKVKKKTKVVRKKKAIKNTRISIPLRSISWYEEYEGKVELALTDGSKRMLEGDEAASFQAMRTHSFGPELIIYG